MPCICTDILLFFQRWLPFAYTYCTARRPADFQGDPIVNLNKQINKEK